MLALLAFSLCSITDDSGMGAGCSCGHHFGYVLQSGLAKWGMVLRKEYIASGEGVSVPLVSIIEAPCVHLLSGT